MSTFLDLLNRAELFLVPNSSSRIELSILKDFGNLLPYPQGGKALRAQNTKPATLKSAARKRLKTISYPLEGCFQSLDTAKGWKEVTERLLYLAGASQEAGGFNPWHVHISQLTSR